MSDRSLYGGLFGGRSEILFFIIVFLILFYSGPGYRSDVVATV